MTINTRPTRIHLEFYVKNGWSFDKVCTIELNPPGIYMNTVTSSSSMIEEIPFDNNRFKSEEKNQMEKQIKKREKLERIRNNDGGDLGK